MVQLGGEIDKLTAKIAARTAAGEVVPVNWLHKQSAYRTLIIQTRTEFAKFAKETGVEISAYAKQSVELAQQSAVAMIEAGLPGSTNLYGGFHTLPSNAVEQLAGTFTDAPGHVSPLNLILDRIGPAAAVITETTLTDGIVRGLHPDEIGKKLRDALQIPLWRGQLIARTEMYRSYREANRAVFHENADVVDKWVWCAHPGSRTCAACLAMDGTEYPTDEPMGSHPNCRCTCIPKTKTWAELGYPEIPDTPVLPPKGRGEEALRNMSEKDQIAAFGNRKLWKGWKDGEYELQDVVRTTNNDLWGVNRTLHGHDGALRQAQMRKAAERRSGSSGGSGSAPKAVRSKRTWHEKTRDRIAEGVNTEEDAREVGKLIRTELEKPAKVSKKELATRIKKRETEIEKLRAERGDLMLTRQNLIPGTGEHKRITKELDDKLNRIFTLEDENVADRDGSAPITPDSIKKALESVRPGYGKGDTSKLQFAAGSQTKSKEHIEAACGYLPQEWVEGYAKIPFKTKGVSRGYFRGPYGNEPVHVYLSGQTSNDSISTAIHELTHFRERTKVGFTDVERAFYKRRTAGETNRWMGPGYSQNEVTKKDKFFEPYCGKDYGRDSFEIATMGVQYLMSPGTKIPPALLADTDYVDLILGLLAAL